MNNITLQRRRVCFRCAAFFLAILLLFPCAISVSADNSGAYSDSLWSNGSYDSSLGDMAGRRLYVYGLAESQGEIETPEKDNEIDMKAREPATRLDAALMLYRICADTEIVDICPFTDVPEEYAPAVSWMYETGITRGISSELFGTGEITRGQFLTMLSRLLAWDMSEADSWNGSHDDALMALAEQDELIPAGISGESFTRGDIYLILLELATRRSPERCVPVRAEMSRPYTITLTADSWEDAQTQIHFALQFAPSRINVSFTEDCPGEDMEAFAALFQKDGEVSAAKELLVSYLSTDSGLYYSFMQRSERRWELRLYSYAPAYLTFVDMSDWLRCYEDENYSQRILEFYEKYVLPLAAESADEYTLARKAQDLICRIASYDWVEYYAIKRDGYGSNPYTHTICGFLSGGLIVCDGYAKTYQWILRCLGVDCFVVYGISGPSEDGHAWNKVRIDGVWYNADVCWKDTGCGDAYFLKSDAYFKNNQHRFSDEYVLTVFASDTNYRW